MPVVEGPGFTIEFPDGTDPQTIDKVMREEHGRRQGAAPAQAAAPKGPETPAWEAALLHGVQGLSMNFSDEAHGLIAALPHALSGDYWDTYGKVVDSDRAHLAKLSKEHPYASIGGEVAGGVAGALGAAPLAIGRGALAAASLGGRVLRGGFAGAAAGGLAGAGAAEGGPAQRFMGAGAGAAVGAPLGIAGEGVAAGVGAGWRAFMGKGKPLSDAAENIGLMTEAGIPYTKGQVTQNLTQLQKEAAMRRDGGLPGEIIAGQDQAQAAALRQHEMGMRDALAGNATPIRAPVEAGEPLMSGIKQRAVSERAPVNAAFEKAEGDLSFPKTTMDELPNRIRKAFDDKLINPDTTPAAHAVLTDIDAALQRIPSVGRGGVVRSDVKLEWLKAQRENINARLRESKFGTQDHRALKIAKDELDFLRDDAINAGLYSGRAGALDDLKKAEGMYAEWAQKYKRQGGKDKAGKFIEDVLDPRSGLTVEQAINAIHGTSDLGLGGVNVTPILKRLEKVLGKDSEEWGALKQGAFMRAMRINEGSVRKELSNADLQERLAKYIDSDLGKGLNTKAELDEMRKQVTRLALTTPEKAGSPGARRAMGHALNIAMTAGGFQVGASMGSGAIGAGVGYAAAQGTKRLWQTVQARQAVKPMSQHVYPQSGIGRAAGQQGSAVADWMYPERVGAGREPLYVEINRYGGK